MVFLERYLLDWGYRVLVKLSVSYSADEILRPVFPESENFCVLPQKLFFKKTVVWNATIHCVICMLIFSAICKNWKKTHPVNCCSFYPIFTNCVHFLKMLRSLLDFFENPNTFVWTRSMPLLQPCRKNSAKCLKIDFFRQSQKIITKLYIFHKSFLKMFLWTQRMQF